MNKILFIDDEPQILESYKKIFSVDQEQQKLKDLANDFFSDQYEESSTSESSFDVLTASQGQEGVKIFEDHLNSESPIKVVFIDMRMPPGISGKETAKLIRDKDPNVEIVIVTAYSDTSLKEVVHFVGAPDKLLYLKKPFDAQEIKQFALNLSSKYSLERVKESFVSSVGHELRTPLSSIMGFEQLLRTSASLNEEDREYLKMIENSSKKLNGIISSLLTCVELQKHGIELEKRSICLGDFMNQEFIRWGFFENEESKIRLLVDENIKAQHYNFDMDKIGECLYQLVDNAFKFSQKGHIYVHASGDQTYFQISVKDEGPGIDKTTKNKIFNAFEKNDSMNTNFDGLGVGLYIVKSITEKHEATLSCESEPGKGTTFSIKVGA